MDIELQETIEHVFGMVEEGLNLRLGGKRFHSGKLHHGLYRAIQFWGFTPGEILDLAPDIANACDLDSSSSISASAFQFLKEIREGQGCFSPLERHTQPPEGSLEWEIDREMLYEIWEPMMVNAVQRGFSWRNKSFMDVLARWMRLFDTQDLIDLAWALLDANDRGMVKANQYLWRLARDPGFRYDWGKVITHSIAWCRHEGLWEGKTKLKLIHVRKKKKSANKRPGNHG